MLRAGGVEEWIAMITALAAPAAETAGFLIGRVLTVALAVALIVWGVRLQGRGRKTAGIIAIVVGALLALALLASLTRGLR